MEINISKRTSNFDGWVDMGALNICVSSLLTQINVHWLKEGGLEEERPKKISKVWNLRT